MLEFVEVALDEIAPAIDVACNGSLDPAVLLGRYMGDSAHGFDPLDEGTRVIATVGHHMTGAREAVDQLSACTLVRGLSRGQGETDRQALLIDDGMDLGAQSSTRQTDGVIRTPFFPPAACWWARMIELSMKAMDSGDRSARALKTLTQTPAFAHRLKRL